jgi:hypothetical protein
LCRGCYSVLYGTSQIDKVEQQFKALLHAYRSGEEFKKYLEDCTDTTGFKDGWSLTGCRFTQLRDFCGGLATVFPGTATVASDFSIVKYVKNDFRTSLTDFSLEVIFHASKLWVFDTQ